MGNSSMQCNTNTCLDCSVVYSSLVLPVVVIMKRPLCPNSNHSGLPEMTLLPPFMRQQEPRVMGA